ncbi:MAG: hypothetical protein GQ574_18790 [Crocinitomix sp.]|nr:hypothetical protein [Crocinitomix sp.]
MKIDFFLLFLFLGFGFSYAQNAEPLDAVIESKEDLIAASKSFEAGNAKSPMQYYVGIMTNLTLIDEFLNSFETLDEENAAIYRFNENIVECLSLIQHTKDAIKLYNSNDWSLQNTLRSNSLDWLNAAEGLMNDYMSKLAEPMSRKADTWNKKEVAFHDKYLEAYDAFLEIDDVWIIFQHEFADANDFNIEGEISIGEDGLLEETEGLDPIEQKNEYKDQAAKFARGEASNGEAYYEGVLAAVLLIDAEFANIYILDDRDAGTDEIMGSINSGLAKIDSARMSLALYTDKTWAKRKKFHKLTLTWLAGIEGLYKDYLIQLAEPLSRADATWSDTERDFYKSFEDAFDKYLKIDSKWIGFQYKFAKANGFSLSGVVDIDQWNDEVTPAEEEE